MKRWPQATSWLAVLTGILLFSTDSIVLRQITLPPVMISCGSHIVTSLVLAVWQWRRLPQYLPLLRDRGLIYRLLVLGVLRGTGVVAFVSAIFLAPVAKVVVISYLFPIYTMLLAYRFLGEPLTGRFIGAALTALIGIVVLVLPELGPASSGELPGLLLAGYVSISVAISRVVLKGIDSAIPSQFILLTEAVLAVVTLAPLAFLTPVGSVSVKAALLVALTGVLYGIIAHAVILVGLRIVPAGPAAVLGYIEPVSSSLLAWWLLAEPISLYTLSGGLLILTGSLMAVLSQMRRPVLTPISYQESTGI